MSKLRWAFCLAIIWYVTFALSIGLKELPRYDDAWYPQYAKTIQETGIPLQYWGEDTAQLYEEHPQSQWVIGLHHPPINQYMQAAFSFLTGWGWKSLRVFNVLMVLIVLILMYVFCKILFKNEAHEAFFLTATLFLINPGIIVQSQVLSIDTGFYPVILFMFCLVFVHQEVNRQSKTGWLGFLLGIALLTKYTVAPFLVISVAMYRILEKKSWQGMKECMIIGAIGVVIFLGVMATYSYFMQLPFDFILRFTLVNRILKGGAPDIIHNLSYTAVYDFLWFSVPLLLFGGLCLTLFLTREKTQPRDFLVFFAGMTYLIHSIKAPGTYYKFPLMPMIFFAGATILWRWRAAYYQKIKDILPLGLLYLFCIFITSADPFILVQMASRELQVGSLVALIIFIGPFIVAPFASKNIRDCLLLWLAFYPFYAMGVTLVQAQSEYSIVSTYGELGFEQAIKNVKQKIVPGDIVVARFDAGYWIGTPFFSDDRLTKKSYCGAENNRIPVPSPCNPRGASYHLTPNEILENASVKYIIRSNYLARADGGIVPELQSVIGKLFTPVETVGHFTIYKRNLIQ